MKKFWSFYRNDAGERVLRLEGPIDEDSFWGDEITPQMFRSELEAEEGDVTVWINSPGGNVFAAAEIFTMLCDHNGSITVKIDAIAASAASVVAMAGDHVLMSPVAMLMIHDPTTIAQGNAKDMEKAISTLNEVKASIINAYQRKTGLSRNKISQLMENETWMNAKKAVELGFADEILFEKENDSGSDDAEEKDDGKEIGTVWQTYSTRIMGQTILNRLGCAAEASAETAKEQDEACGHAQDMDPPEAGVSDMAAEAVNAPEEEQEAPVEEQETPAATADASQEENTAPVEKAKETPPAVVEQSAKTEQADVADKPTAPVIGLDGKTEDGAMPYALLIMQLEFLK